MDDDRDARRADGNAILQAHHLPAASSLRRRHRDHVHMAHAATNTAVTTDMINAPTPFLAPNMIKTASNVHPAKLNATA
jgi:hypothetical protein